MASAACTNLSYKHFNGDWSGWKDHPQLYGGYAGHSTYTTLLYFKTPPISNNAANTSLTFVIPWVRQGSTAKSGYLYLKLYEYDTNNSTTNPPKNGTTIGPIANSSTCDASAYWSATDREIHTSTFTMTKTVKPNTAYVVRIGCSTNFLEIGYSGKSTYKLFSITYNYTNYTNVGTGTTTITDNYNNTFRITATKGAGGTSNPVKGLDTLQWGYTNSYGNTYTSGSNISLTLSGTAATRTVYARSRSVATYGTSPIHAVSKAIKQYIAPSTPGKPALSYTKNRLTIKEDWVYSWAASTATNTSSPVKGYRIRLYKNGVTIPIIDAAGTVLTTTGAETYYDSDSTSTSITINPEACGIKAGDNIKFSVTPYTRYGESNTGAQLFGSAATSDASVVQNAGVIHAKISNQWSEGQVYAKLNGEWKEAEVVSAKINGSWKESE